MTKPVTTDYVQGDAPHMATESPDRLSVRLTAELAAARAEIAALRGKVRQRSAMLSEQVEHLANLGW